MNPEDVKKLIQTAEEKLAFLKQKQLIGGLSADQEFALEHEIAELETNLTKWRSDLSNAYGLHTESGQAILAEKIRKLDVSVDGFGELNLINCDREESADRFWDDFDLRLNSRFPFQFYFILACPNQQPNSFSERMVVEIILYDLDEADDAILCKRDAKNRLEFEKIPVSRSLDRSQKEFKKYFAERFKLGDKTMEKYLETGLPKLSYKYVTTVFTLEADSWRDFSKDYLNWIVEQFMGEKQDIPTFLFFFVINMKDAHQDNLPPIYEKIKVELREIQAEHLEIVTLLNNLFPVPRHLVETWVRENVGERNNAKIEEVVDMLVRGLKPDLKRQYERDKTLNMTEIERFQALVYEIVSKE